MSKAFEIRRPAVGSAGPIRELYVRCHRPSRGSLRLGEYFVALAGGEIVGCAAVHDLEDGGYLYGLAVARQWRQQGVGSALVRVRLDHLRRRRVSWAVLLAMFWNVRFFRRFGFEPVARLDLPRPILRLSDFRNPVYRRSAALVAAL